MRRLNSVRNLIRVCSALSLALILSVTSFTLASARGHAPVAGKIEICSGLGLQTITVDADGNPVGPPHICPDGVASFLTVDASVPVLPLRRLANGERLRLPQGNARVQPAPVQAVARGPPAA